jgi:hypothetical protein
MRFAAASLFASGALVSGALVYGGLAFAVSAADASFVARVAAIAWITFCLCWHALGFVKVPFGRAAIQANRRWTMKGAGGLVYFGALLGIGLLTQMSSPLVLGGAFAAASSSVGWAILYGLGFGGGRSVPAFAGAIYGLGGKNPAELAEHMTRRGRAGVSRLAGSAASLLALGLLLNAFR